MRSITCDLCGVVGLEDYNNWSRFDQKIKYVGQYPVQDICDGCTNKLNKIFEEWRSVNHA